MVVPTEVNLINMVDCVKLLPTKGKAKCFISVIYLFDIIINIVVGIEFFFVKVISFVIVGIRSDICLVKLIKNVFKKRVCCFIFLTSASNLFYQTHIKALSKRAISKL